MQLSKVKDIMIPVGRYATIYRGATLLDMVHVLDESNRNIPEGHYKIRSVLVTDDNGKIVGKVGHLAFLKALEPKYERMADFDKLAKAGMSAEFLNTMMDNLRLWNNVFFDIAQRAKITRVGDVMHPISECIDVNTDVGEAIHKMIMWQALSIPVVRGKEVVGIIRQADLYREIASYIKEVCEA